MALAALRRVRRRLLGYVFQRPADNLIPYLSVTEHLQLAARLRGVRDADGSELLELLGLADRRHHLPSWTAPRAPLYWRRSVLLPPAAPV